jgi:hypothetical protein
MNKLEGPGRFLRERGMQMIISAMPLIPSPQAHTLESLKVTDPPSINLTVEDTPRNPIIEVSESHLSTPKSVTTEKMIFQNGTPSVSQDTDSKETFPNLSSENIILFKAITTAYIIGASMRSDALRRRNMEASYKDSKREAQTGQVLISTAAIASIALIWRL